MNKTVTSKELLLNAAKKIAYQEGFSHLNIRRLSQECGIAVGSVYNYFPSKSDLLFAIAEDFWFQVFHHEMCDFSTSLCFSDFFVLVYERLFQSLKDFELGLLRQMSQLSADEREKGKGMEEKWWEHMRFGLLAALERDPHVHVDWSPDFSKEAFIHFVFFNMIAMLRSGQKDCSFFEKMLQRLLYQA